MLDTPYFQWLDTFVQRELPIQKGLYSLTTTWKDTEHWLHLEEGKVYGRFYLFQFESSKEPQQIRNLAQMPIWMEDLNGLSEERWYSLFSAWKEAVEIVLTHTQSQDLELPVDLISHSILHVHTLKRITHHGQYVEAFLAQGRLGKWLQQDTQQK